MRWLKKLVDLKGLNELLKDRGAEIVKLEHPDGIKDVVAKTNFLILYREGEVVEFGKGESTEVTFDIDKFNYFLLDRKIELLHVVNEDYKLFKKFTPQFLFPLKFHMKHVGSWTHPALDPKVMVENKKMNMGMHRHPRINRVI